MFQFKLAYKMRSKTLLIGTLLLAAYTVLGVVGLKDGVSWFYIKLFLPILPVFYASNVVSEEYEHSRAGIIFTTCTPIYIQVIKRFLSALFLNCGLISFLYICAYSVGFEKSLLGIFPMLAYTCFFCTLGLTFCNLTHKNAVGYAVVVLYWGLFFMVGNKANEVMMPISTMINMDLYYDIVWYNVLCMFALALILFLFNIWLVGRGEGIRKKIVGISIPTIILLIFCLIFAPNDSYLTRTNWQVVEEDNISLAYQDLPEEITEEFMTIWSTTFDVLTDVLGETNVSPLLQVSCETGLTEDPIYQEGATTLSLKRQYLNPTSMGGSYFHTIIPEVAFDTYFFGNIEDHALTKGFSTYLFNTRINENIYAKDNTIVNTKYFKYFTASEEKEGYLSDLAYYSTATTFEPWQVEALSGLILQVIDEASPTALNDFLVALHQVDDLLSIEDIRTLAYDFADNTRIDQAFVLYTQALSTY